MNALGWRPSTLGDWAALVLSMVRLRRETAALARSTEALRTACQSTERTQLLARCKVMLAKVQR